MTKRYTLNDRDAAIIHDVIDELEEQSAALARAALAPFSWSDARRDYWSRLDHDPDDRRETRRNP